MSVRSQVSTFVYDIVGDVAISFNVGQQQIQKGRVDEKLKVSLDEQRMSSNSSNQQPAEN